MRFGARKRLSLLVLAPIACASTVDQRRDYTVSVELDREPFVYGSAYPVGDTPPYTARTGFRFPAPIGAAALELEYGGCRLRSGERSEVTLQTSITVEEGRVTEVRFDGDQLTALPARDDDVVTLEDIYQAVTGAPKASP